MSFATDLQALIDKARGDANRAVRQSVVLATQSLVLKSPVDTGRFRANWVMGVGAVDRSTSVATSKDGSAAIARIAEQMQTQEEGTVFYITNSLPYARPLEYGHSKQAPNGMVRLTVVELPNLIKTYAEGLQ